MTSITVNGNTIDPEENVSQHSEDSNFILIQGYHDLNIEEKRQLSNMSVEFQEYVSEHTYLCRYLPEDLQRVQTLSFVRTANIYHPELKTTVSLKNMVEREASRTEYEIDLILHKKPNLTPLELAPRIAQTAGVEIGQLEVLSNKIRVTVNQDKLDNLAALDSVNRIEEVRLKACYNDQARAVLQVDSGTVFNKYQGTGQMVCVADTGFDQGLATDTANIKIHPAFTNRIDNLVSFWVPDARDPTGHGTHVCGSVCGSGIYKDSAQGNEIAVEGTAPGAKLMVQSLSIFSKALNKWVLKAPADLWALFEKPYTKGIRIHTNSWGNVWDAKTGQLGYEADASTIDKFVHQHQDFVVLIAAGNDARKGNCGNSQIGDNGAAKNCITVGACGSSRPNDGERYDPSCPPLSSIAETAIFSSRGPTKPVLDAQGRVISPGRIKPDVVAPGVAVLSTASRTVAADARIRVQNGTSEDEDWLFLSGTSMATPLVAGCVALIREAIQERGKQQPSAALVKALLINGAVNYSSPGGLGYDYQQGFGRVDVQSSIAMTEQSPCSGFVDGGCKFEPFDEFDVPALRVTPAAKSRWISPEIPVPSKPNRLVATLVYPDKEGTLLQNNVNLIVRAGEAERHGNMGSGTEFDNTNNVEKVIWENVDSATVTIIAQAQAFLDTDADQPFAIVWSIQTL